MHINKIQLNNFRGFGEGEILDIHPEITVITGRNDVGKTSILDVIYLMLSYGKAIQDDLNLTAKYNGQKLGGAIGFILTGDFIKYFPTLGDVQQNSELELAFTLDNQIHLITEVKRPDGRRQTLSTHGLPTMLPNVVFMKNDERVHSNIYISNLNSAEKVFWYKIFGKLESIEQEDSRTLRNLILKAKNNINTIIGSYFPNLEIRLEIEMIAKDENTNEKGVSLS